MISKPTAQDELRNKQQAFPPPADGEQASRVAGIVDALRPSLPPELSALLESDRVAIGELGEAHPDVATWPSGERFVVTFSTGMFDFIDTLVYALSARFINPGTNETASATGETVRRVRDALTVYRRQTNVLWSVFRPKFSLPDVPVSPDVRAVRSQLIGLVQRFLLAHELGHVAIGTGVRPALTSNEEDDADRYGLEFALKSALESNNQSLAVAAAGLAIRFYVSLERFGARFTSAYPPMAERLNTLQASLLALLGSQQRVDEVSRFLVAMLDFMDDLDNQIEPALPAIPLTADRIRVGVIARLYEVARGNVSQTMFVNDLNGLVEASNPEAVATGLTSVCEYYWDWANTAGVYIRDLPARTTYAHDWIIANSRALRAVMPDVAPAILERIPARFHAAR